MTLTSRLAASTTAMALAIAVVVLMGAGRTFSADPRPGAIIDRCERIEQNHVYNDLGERTFTQFIFYEWDRQAAVYRVVDWRIVKDSAALTKRGGEYRLLFYDDGRLRQVRAVEYRETWTQYDPELFEREAWPVEFRKRLSEPWKLERSVLKR